jgi:hypothetical protein
VSLHQYSPCTGLAFLCSISYTGSFFFILSMYQAMLNYCFSSHNFMSTSELESVVTFIILCNGFSVLNNFK